MSALQPYGISAMAVAGLVFYFREPQRANDVVLAVRNGLNVGEEVAVDIIERAERIARTNKARVIVTNATQHLVLARAATSGALHNLLLATNIAWMKLDLLPMYIKLQYFGPGWDQLLAIERARMGMGGRVLGEVQDARGPGGGGARLAITGLPPNDVDMSGTEEAKDKDGQGDHLARASPNEPFGQVAQPGQDADMVSVDEGAHEQSHNTNMSQAESKHRSPLDQVIQSDQDTDMVPVDDAAREQRQIAGVSQPGPDHHSPLDQVVQPGQDTDMVSIHDDGVREQSHNNHSASVSQAESDHPPPQRPEDTGSSQGKTPAVHDDESNTVIGHPKYQHCTGVKETGDPCGRKRNWTVERSTEHWACSETHRKQWQEGETIKRAKKARKAKR